MAPELESLNQARQVNTPFPYTRPIRQWKKGGKKVIGFTCTYCPEEIIYAGGMLPVRLTGDSKELQLEDANAYLYLYTCSFARSCFQLRMEGQYDFLDGFVGSSTCDPIRRMVDVWENYTPTPFQHVVSVPRQFTAPAEKLYLHQLKSLKESLEHFFAVTITNRALAEAIALYNRNRALLSQLYGLRKGVTPPLTGAEVMEITNAGLRMPKTEHNALLEKLLAELRLKKRSAPDGVRLMLSGSIINNPDFLRGIEELGAIFVADNLCTGGAYFLDPVAEGGGSPLEALAHRYLNHFPCARMFPGERRFDRIMEMVKEYRVQGVVSQVIRYCAPYARHIPPLTRRLEQAGIPHLVLDVEYGMPATGQVRTRAQAFLEMLAGR